MYELISKSLSSNWWKRVYEVSLIRGLSRNLRFILTGCDKSAYIGLNPIDIPVTVNTRATIVTVPESAIQSYFVTASDSIIAGNTVIAGQKESTTKFILELPIDTVTGICKGLTNSVVLTYGKHFYKKGASYVFNTDPRYYGYPLLLNGVTHYVFTAVACNHEIVTGKKSRLFYGNTSDAVSISCIRQLFRMFVDGWYLTDAALHISGGGITATASDTITKAWKEGAVNFLLTAGNELYASKNNPIVGEGSAVLKGQPLFTALDYTITSTDSNCRINSQVNDSAIQVAIGRLNSAMSRVSVTTSASATFTQAVADTTTCTACTEVESAVDAIILTDKETVISIDIG